MLRIICWPGVAFLDDVGLARVHTSDGKFCTKLMLEFKVDKIKPLEVLTFDLQFLKVLKIDIGLKNVEIEIRFIHYGDAVHMPLSRFT